MVSLSASQEKNSLHVYSVVYKVMMFVCEQLFLLSYLMRRTDMLLSATC